MSKFLNKFVNISSQEGVAKDSVLLEGRRGCNCQATKHDLINNCLSCGKIVCKQEGIEYIMHLKSIIFYVIIVNLLSLSKYI